MFGDIGRKTKSQEFAEAVYFLHKEVGLTYSDIFGHRETVEVEQETSRDGLVGKYVDRLIGKPSRTRTKVVRTPGMNVKTFLTYMELMQQDAKQQERDMKKQKMRGKM